VRSKVPLFDIKCVRNLGRMRLIEKKGVINTPYPILRAHCDNVERVANVLLAANLVVNDSDETAEYDSIDEMAAKAGLHPRRLHISGASSNSKATITVTFEKDRVRVFLFSTGGLRYPPSRIARLSPHARINNALLAFSKHMDWDLSRRLDSARVRMAVDEPRWR